MTRRQRERERDLLSQKGKPREARLLEFTRFDACLRVSPGFRQRALEDISAWVGRVYPAQAKSVGRPRSIGGGAESSRFVGRSRSIVTVRCGDIRHFSLLLSLSRPWRTRGTREESCLRCRDICIEVSARGAFCSVVAIHGGGAKRFCRGTKMGNGNGKRSQSMRVCRWWMRRSRVAAAPSPVTG